MKTVSIEIQGITPLLQHRMTEDQLFGLLGAKTQKNKDLEEKTPRDIAESHAYKCQKTGKFYVPAEYITGAVATVAGDYKQKNSARRSLKAVARGVFRPVAGQIDLLGDDDKPVKDFEVDVRKGTNHQKGAVAICRPRFDRWRLSFEATINDTIVSEQTIHQMLNDAGMRSGIGAFRVSKGGVFGSFRVTKFSLKKN